MPPQNKREIKQQIFKYVGDIEPPAIVTELPPEPSPTPIDAGGGVDTPESENSPIVESTNSGFTAENLPPIDVKEDTPE